jgi:hypothetical protein
VRGGAVTGHRRPDRRLGAGGPPYERYQGGEAGRAGDRRAPRPPRGAGAGAVTRDRQVRGLLRGFGQTRRPLRSSREARPGRHRLAQRRPGRHRLAQRRPGA